MGKSDRAWVCAKSLLYPFHILLSLLQMFKFGLNRSGILPDNRLKPLDSQPGRLTYWVLIWYNFDF